VPTLKRESGRVGEERKEEGIRGEGRGRDPKSWFTPRMSEILKNDCKLI